MNRFKNLVLAALLVALLLAVGCARVIHKEYEIVDGKSVVRSDTEYDRIGDQTMSGLEAIKNTPDGTQVSVTVEQQKSEGKLQIEGLVAAIGEALSPWLGGEVTPEVAEAIKVAVEQYLAASK